MNLRSTTSTAALAAAMLAVPVGPAWAASPLSLPPAVPITAAPLPFGTVAVAPAATVAAETPADSFQALARRSAPAIAAATGGVADERTAARLAARSGSSAAEPPRTGMMMLAGLAVMFAVAARRRPRG